jgi:hypothetical protein
MNVYFDELKLTENPVIGLVYSTGIEYVETLSREYSTDRYYEREISYEQPDDEFCIHSEEVKYNVKIHNVSSFSKVEVYEYNMNHDLLGVKVLEDWYDIFDLNADKDAIYAYLKVYTQEKRIGETFKTYFLNVGDDIDVYLSDEYGMVWNQKIYYKYVQ